MDPHRSATRPYLKSCKNCALCCDEDYNIKILNYEKLYKKVVFKNVGRGN